MMESAVLERIKYICSSNNYSETQFSKVIGMEQRTVNGYMNGSRKPSLTFIHKILSSFEHINADWLLTGRGPMLTENSQIDSFQRKSAPEDENMDADRFMKALYRKESQLEKMQEQIDKLLTIIENLTNTEKNSSASTTDLAQTG